MGDLYQIGKDIEKIERRLNTVEALMNEVYNIVKHNLETKVLTMPKEEDKEQ